MSTTPNSPTVWANVSTEALRNPLAERGTATVANASRGLARILAAASRGARPTAAKAVCSGCTMNGREYTTDAITRPENENVKESPVTWTQRDPIAEPGCSTMSR